jgi:hypothetical protein
MTRIEANKPRVERVDDIPVIYGMLEYGMLEYGMLEYGMLERMGLDAHSSHRG